MSGDRGAASPQLIAVAVAAAIVVLLSGLVFLRGSDSKTATAVANQSTTSSTTTTASSREATTQTTSLPHTDTPAGSSDPPTATSFRPIPKVRKKWSVAVDPGELDFGQVPVDQKSVRSFKLSNDGTEDVEILIGTEPDFRISGDYSDYRRRVLASGSTDTVEVVFEPSAPSSYRVVAEVAYGPVGAPTGSDGDRAVVSLLGQGV